MLNKDSNAGKGRRFDATWRRLAEKGICDDYGGGEWRRVRKEWRKAGYPPPTRFIRRVANRPLPFMCQE